MKEEIFLVNCKNIVDKLFEILEIELEELTHQEKELLIAYSFGMISTMVEEKKLVPDIEYLGIKKIITEVFQYSKQEANNILKKLMDSGKEGGDEAFNIMVHQGKFVYPKYKANNYNEVYDRLTNIIDVVVSGEYRNY